jgi:hypothetical protein
MKSKKLSYNKILVLFSIIVVSVLMTGCNGGAPPLINIFSASPSTINQGESSTLTWSVSDADTVTITPGVGTVDSSDSIPVSPEVTTTYTLIATNSAGSVTATATVMVIPLGLDGPIVNNFSASPSTINPGESSTLTWDVSKADTVTITPGVGTVASSDSTSVSPAVTTAYTLIATNSAGGVTATTTVTVSSVAVGDSYGGGIVAYILQSGDTGYDANVQHGLIAATADQSTGIQWYNGSYVVTGATGTAIGTGQANTTAIVNIQGAGSYAAKLCHDLTVGGYNDWFLPSKDELDKLYTNKVAIGGFAGYGYWSSSEANAGSAWYQVFGNGDQPINSKGNALRVRAVRAF